VNERLTIRETLVRIRADRRRLGELLGRPLLFHRSLVCVVLYRISNHFFRAGRHHLARIVWHLNTFLTGADISPPADLGEGLVILSPPGTAIMARAGRNLTVMPLAGLGSELGRREDVGAGAGLPVLGDDVVLEPHSGVLGPVRIGDRVRIGAGALALTDLDDDAVLEAPAPRHIKRHDLR
jgi:serine O-acetyltransferase